MGNCLSHDPWTRLRRKHFEFNKMLKESSTAPKTIAFQITNVVNVPVNNSVVSVPGANNVVSVPVANNVVSVPVANSVVSVPGTSNVVVSVPVKTDDVTNVSVQNDAVSMVVSKVAAEAPKDVGMLQMNSFRNVSIFTYSELSLATSHFRPDLILGEGGFGLVYKGVIDGNVRPGFQSTEVAVKELNPDGYQGDREWLAEVNYLGNFSHPNLVKLIGYCCEDDHRLLVYEYMACGSLETHLFRRHNTLSWSTRMKIALDAAKGLAFLHGAERPIIYRDFKTSNILLDAGFNAKLSDFGLAKEGPMGDQTHVSTRVMGTYGYAAPEYVMTGHLTARSDVYGFGVVLLELIVGKRALDKNRQGQEKNLVEWARPLLIRTTKLLRILDPRMEGQYSSKTAGRVANLAHRCLSENPKIRPTMSEVVKDLETYNEEEALIQRYRAAKKLEENSNEDTGSPSAEPTSNEGAMHSKKRINPGNARDGHSSDSDTRHKNSRLVPHSSPESNGPQKQPRAGRNGCSPSADDRRIYSISAPNVGISGFG